MARSWACLAIPGSWRSEAAGSCGRNDPHDEVELAFRFSYLPPDQLY